MNTFINLRSGDCLRHRALTLRAAPLRVASLRVSIAIAAMCLSACSRPADALVDSDTDSKLRKIAAGNTLDSRFARVVLADGRATVREVKTWLAESDAASAIEARRAETGTGSVEDESAAPKEDAR